VVGVSLAIPAAGHAASPAEERPIALPPFIVEEMAKGPPWRYAEVEGYEILSRSSDGVTRRVVEAHHQLHQLLAAVLPPRLQVKMAVPRALILYDEELQPAASKEVISRMLRNPSEPPELPGFGGRGGLRAPASRQRYSFLPNLRLWDKDSMAVFMIVRQEDFNADQLSLTHDYVSFLVRSRLPALPLWFVQGFLALHQQMTYSGRRLTLEPMRWISEAHTAALEKDPKLAPPVRPLAEFLSHKFAPRDPAATYDPAQAWQSQAALFVRWGLDANRGALRPALWKFAERSAVQGTSENLFRECFGFDFAAAQVQLAAYLPQAVRRTIHFRPAVISKLPALPLRNASDGQIARIKGDWERLEVPYVKAILPELAPKYLEQARRTLKRAYDRGERDPRLLAVLGLCEADAGNEGEAREYLEAATRIGAIRPRANYELARLRFAELQGRPAGGGGKLSVTQTAEVLRPLFAARADPPPLPEVYELIAAVWAASESAPTRGHLAVLDEGVRLFPRRIDLVLDSAELNLRHGFREEAEALIEIGRRIANSGTAQQRIAALQERLETN
jgi:hypothetical protein